MNRQSPPLPSSIVLHRVRRCLELGYANGETLELDAEYLRVFSPSAEVRGHGSGQEVLQWGKKDVAISRIEPVGNYALQLVFDDDHDTGIYAWEYLYQLGREYQANWQQYLTRLEQAGKSRDPSLQILKL
jgi:DUF971 family protein